MATIILHPPQVGRTSLHNPDHCPNCGSSNLQHWGTIKRTIRDAQIGNVEVHRWRCKECRTTFRSYPDGIGQASQSERIRNLAALLWMMGLSSREIATTLENAGIKLSRATIWRDARQLTEQKTDSSTRVRYVEYRPQSESRRRSWAPNTLLVVRLEPSQQMVIGALNEDYARETFLEEMRPIARRLSIRVCVEGVEGKYD